VNSMIKLEVHIPYTDLTLSSNSQYNLRIFHVKDNPLGISTLVEKFDDMSNDPDYFLYDSSDKMICSGYGLLNESINEDHLGTGGLYANIYLDYFNFTRD
jgi:hypothetical protein